MACLWGEGMEQNVRAEQPVWYAMSATYRRELRAQSLLDAQSVDSFIPMRQVLCAATARHPARAQLVPVVHNLIFVRTTPAAIRQVKQGIPFLQYLTWKHDGRRHPIVVPDREMERFMAVCNTLDGHLRYFKPDDVSLDSGTQVRIVGGLFDGQEGVLVRVKGCRSKRVVVMVQGVIAVAIKPEDGVMLEKITV